MTTPREPFTVTSEHDPGPDAPLHQPGLSRVNYICRFLLPH